MRLSCIGNSRLFKAKSQRGSDITTHAGRDLVMGFNGPDAHTKWAVWKWRNLSGEGMCGVSELVLMLGLCCQVMIPGNCVFWLSSANIYTITVGRSYSKK